MCHVTQPAHVTSPAASHYPSPLAAIITAEGDVIKFAGDALLAFWSCSKFEAVQTVNRVLTKCLKMQRDYDNYQTVGGSILRMKLGISVGNLDMYHIGEAYVLGTPTALLYVCMCKYVCACAHECMCACLLCPPASHIGHGAFMLCEHLLVHSVCGHHCDGLCKCAHAAASLCLPPCSV